jgi:C-terminal processing protease CtpA/Prc
VVVLSSTPTQTPIPLSDIQQYLSGALDIIQENALNSDAVDWERMRPKLIASVKDAKSPEDTYNTIRYILGLLPDHHSYFYTPSEAENFMYSTAEDYPTPIGKLVDEKLGYVALFGFRAHLEVEQHKYADNIQNIIINFSEQNVCGWIVDLRNDTGGNMFPMVAGLGALIGEGQLGAIEGGNFQKTSWSYLDGKSWMGDEPITAVSHPEFTLNPDEVPVAILIGSHTISAGEFTAISFFGRPNTQFFGKPSGGYTTGVQGFSLSDDAWIMLATTVIMDRSGQIIDGSIIPDVVSSNPEEDAMKWLLEQPACAK